MKSKEQSIFKIRWILFLIGTTAVVFSLPLLMVWQHAATVELIEKNNRLQGKIEEARAQNTVTKMRMEAFLSPEYIELTAKERLNMQYPDSNRVVFIRSGGYTKPQRQTALSRLLKKLNG